MFMLKSKKKQWEWRWILCKIRYYSHKEVALGQVWDEFKETFEHTLSHFNVKRIQQRELGIGLSIGLLIW